MIVLIFAAAMAAEPDPYRCEAVFQGPVAACGISQNIVATGHGRNEDQARKAAQARLVEAISAAASVRAVRAADTLASAETRSEVNTCARVSADAARVHCYSEPELNEKRLCFASFEDSSCWRGQMIDLEGPAWKMMETGRTRICARLDETLQDAEAEHRLSCETRCKQQARVRCPS
jgi:uncharacterized membrane protein